MKENSFYSDDFEELIRGKTEQYKMYPSENVWKGVHSALHTKRKWFIGSMAVLVTGILFFAGRELIAPNPNHTTALHKPATSVASIPDPSKATASASIAPVPLAAIRPANPSTPASRHSTAAGNLSTEETDPAYAGMSITLSHPVLSQSDLSEWLSRVVRLPEQAPAIAVIETKPPSPEVVKEEGTPRTPELVAAHKEPENTLADADAHTVIEELSAGGASRSNRQGGRLLRTASDRSSVAGSQLSGNTGENKKASATAIAEENDRSRINWLHD